MEPSALLREITPVVVTTVEGIRPDQLDAPTPCTEFRVREVLDHTLVLADRFAHRFRGETPRRIDSPAATATAAPVAEVRKAMEDLAEAMDSPGAMQRTIGLPAGEMSGEDYARMVVFDFLVHGWDLAVATGQDYDPSSEVVREVTAFAQSAITPAMRAADMFKAPTSIPPGATPLERLVAYSGRTL